ncbi:hypothetical protein AJ79_09390 [Helicocarpus griseus UAMH5409]|uniref:Phosphatidylinositol-specific phospholipase C X domain-containing protein n=1 Tax=Helicocarpus griseus UAMH5409 TaxID=1447875 RepID=A0A2B7WK82_9EURO|nr:hypothetical protein AJ79_09390 [Helicocarpus griseus UAMH5409]
MRTHRLLAVLACFNFPLIYAIPLGQPVTDCEGECSQFNRSPSNNAKFLSIRDDNGQCSPKDKTYSDEDMPDGIYEADSSPGSQYITIVNLTPYRCPQGRARQNLAEYSEDVGDTPVDTNGEAYYKIEGTDKKFSVKATTKIPDKHPRRAVIDLTGMGLGRREYKFPDKRLPVTLVITGSEEYGFTTSLKHGPGNWMRRMYSVIGDRDIQHIVLPGTHDSAMSTISGKITSIGTKENTQTQGINIYSQLKAGARWFDLRIGTVHPVPDDGSWEFWSMHVNDELAEIAVGNTGESLDQVILEINNFTNENPGEVIFFRVRYLVGLRQVPSLGPVYWGEKIWHDFINKLKKVNNRCPDMDTKVQFQKQKASYFMDRNGGNGCVVFLLDEKNLKEAPSKHSVKDGIYSATMVDFWDNWSEKEDIREMANDQIADWQGVDRKSNKDNRLLNGQWLVSADIVETTFEGIENLSVNGANPVLYWKGVNNMSPEKWPNILMVDYIGVVVPGETEWEQLSAELYTLVVGLNLYMISENCRDISKRRSPLLPKV